MSTSNFTTEHLLILFGLWVFAGIGIALLAGRIIKAGMAEGPTARVIDFGERRQQLSATVSGRGN